MMLPRWVVDSKTTISSMSDRSFTDFRRTGTSCGGQG
jgi:hypothetical protein